MYSETEVEKHFADGNETIEALIEIIDSTTHAALFEEPRAQVPHVTLRANEGKDPPGVHLRHNDQSIPEDIQVGGYVDLLSDVEAVTYYHGVVDALYMQRLVREMEPEGGPPWKGEVKRKEEFRVYLEERKKEKAKVEGG